MSGAAGFFVKHVQTGMCINDTSKIQSKGHAWGTLYFVELSHNCLDPAAQFRFRDNGAMLNLKKRDVSQLILRVVLDIGLICSIFTLTRSV